MRVSRKLLYGFRSQHRFFRDSLPGKNLLASLKKFKSFRNSITVLLDMGFIQATNREANGLLELDRL